MTRLSRKHGAARPTAGKKATSFARTMILVPVAAAGLSACLPAANSVAGQPPPSAPASATAGSATTSPAALNPMSQPMGATPTPTTAALPPAGLGGYQTPAMIPAKPPATTPPPAPAKPPAMTPSKPPPATSHPASAPAKPPAVIPAATPSEVSITVSPHQKW